MSLQKYTVTTALRIPICCSVILTLLSRDYFWSGCAPNDQNGIRKPSALIFLCAMGTAIFLFCPKTVLSGLCSWRPCRSKNILPARLTSTHFWTKNTTQPCNISGRYRKPTEISSQFGIARMAGAPTAANLCCRTRM